MKTKRNKQDVQATFYPTFSHWLVGALSLTSFFSLNVNAQTASNQLANVVDIDTIPANQKVVFTGKKYNQEEMVAIATAGRTNFISLAPGLIPVELGDIDLDGRDDLAFYEPQFLINGSQVTYRSVVYVAYGADFSGTVDLTALSPGQGTMIVSNPKNLFSAFFPLSKAGNVFGNPNADILIDEGVVGTTGERNIYWIEGGRFNTSLIAVEQSPLVHSMRIVSGSSNILQRVISVGDIDKKGKSDLLNTSPGGAQLIYMETVPTTIFLSNASLPLVQTFPLPSNSGIGGAYTSAVGDSRGTGNSDFIISPLDPSVLKSKGALIFGRTSFDKPLSLVNLTSADGRLIALSNSSSPATPPLGNLFFPAGDFNNDGLADYGTATIQAPRINIVFGSNTSNTFYLDQTNQTTGVVIGDSGVSMAQQKELIYVPIISAGPLNDVDGDGNDDIYALFNTAANGTTSLKIVFGGKASGVFDLNSATAVQSVSFVRNPINGTVAPYSITSVSAAGNVYDKKNADIVIGLSTLHTTLGGSNAAVLLKGSFVKNLALAQTGTTPTATGSTTKGSTIATTVVGQTTGSQQTGVATSNTDTTSTTAVVDPTGKLQSPTMNVGSSTASTNSASRQFHGMDFLFTVLMVNLVVQFPSNLSFLFNLLTGLVSTSSSVAAARAPMQTEVTKTSVVAATQVGVFGSISPSQSRGACGTAAMTPSVDVAAAVARDNSQQCKH